MKGKTWGNLVLCILIFVFFIFAVQKISATPSFSVLLDPPVKISESAKDFLESVKVIRPGIKVWDNENIVETSFALENKSGHDVKNMEIVCTFYDKMNRDLGDRAWIVYDTLKAYDQHVFQSQNKMFINKRAARISCQLVDLELVGKLTPVEHGGHGDDHGKSDH